MNWIHAAARRFRNGTSFIGPLRVRSTRLISAAFGSSIAGLCSGQVRRRSTLRGKRTPAEPSFGFCRLFHAPSGVRKNRTPGGGGRSCRRESGERSFRIGIDEVL